MRLSPRLRQALRWPRLEECLDPHPFASPEGVRLVIDALPVEYYTEYPY